MAQLVTRAWMSVTRRESAAPTASRCDAFSRGCDAALAMAAASRSDTGSGGEAHSSAVVVALSPSAGSPQTMARSTGSTPVRDRAPAPPSSQSAKARSASSWREEVMTLHSRSARSEGQPTSAAACCCVSTFTTSCGKSCVTSASTHWWPYTQEDAGG